MESFDVDLALRLALDSKKAEESDSMVLYVRNLGVDEDTTVISICNGKKTYLSSILNGKEPNFEEHSKGHFVFDAPAYTMYKVTNGVDFQNMLNALKQSYKLQSTDKAYICYAVDLVNSIIYFEAFEAVDLKGARNTACTYLSNTLGEKVLVKNLQLNANKNSKVAHANNLANAYIGRLNEMNKYGTYSKYLVGCVKLSSGLIHTQILDDWVYQCY